MPRNIVALLNTHIVKVVSSPEIKDALNKQGFEPQTNTPAQFAALMEREIAQNTELAKQAGVQPQ